MLALVSGVVNKAINLQNENKTIYLGGGSMLQTILKFLRPYRGLCALTIFALLLDTAGALFIPTVTANMINHGDSTGVAGYAECRCNF